jgi:hypothetical protein
MRMGPDLEVIELEGPVPPALSTPTPTPARGLPVWLLLAAALLAALVVRAAVSSPHPARAGFVPALTPLRPSEVGSLYACDGRMDGLVIFGSLPPGQVVQVEATPLRGPDVDLPGPSSYRIAPDGRLQLTVADLRVPGTVDRLSFLATPLVESAVIGWSVGVPVIPCPGPGPGSGSGSGRGRATAPR